MSSKRPVELGREGRLFLLVLSEINLVMGALFFVYPDLMITLWPWTVKALAARFIGAIFLAIAFGCWSALRARIWQRAKILVLVGGTFFGITSIVSILLSVSQGGGYAIYVWTGYFLAASLGNLAILYRYRWQRKPQDRLGSGRSWRTARWFFRIQTSVVGVFGIMMLLIPDVAQAEFWPWKVAVPTMRMFAALFLATCLATGWASLQSDVGRIRVLLPLDMIFPSLALLAVGIHWEVISRESPGILAGALVAGVWVFIYSFVAVGSAYLYFCSRKIMIL